MEEDRTFIKNYHRIEEPSNFLIRELITYVFSDFLDRKEFRIFISFFFVLLSLFIIFRVFKSRTNH